MESRINSSQGDGFKISIASRCGRGHRSASAAANIRGGDTDKAKGGRLAWVKPEQAGLGPFARGLLAAIPDEARGFPAVVEPRATVHRGSGLTGFMAVKAEPASPAPLIGIAEAR